MQRTSTARLTSGQHQRGVRPRAQVQRQSSSTASSGSCQVHGTQYRSFMPRCSHGASSMAAIQNAAGSTPSSCQTASAVSSCTA